MSSNNKNLHLTVQERIIIEKGIENGSTKAAIALTISKDKSTVGKEIKKHRELVHKSSYKINCANMKNCSHNHGFTRMKIITKIFDMSFGEYNVAPEKIFSLIKQ